MRCYYCDVIGHLRAACPDREEVAEDELSGSESESEDDFSSVEYFGANASNWDGSHQDYSDVGSQRLIIDEVPETQPDNPNVNRPFLPISTHNASTSAAPAANNHLQVTLAQVLVMMMPLVMLHMTRIGCLI